MSQYFSASVVMNNSVLTEEEVHAALREGMMRLAVRKWRESHGQQSWPSASWLRQFEQVDVKLEG